MKNRNNLPDWVVESVKHARDSYNPGEESISATNIIKPALIWKLERQFEVEEDVSDLIASFDGTCLHAGVEKALEENSRYVVEKRFYKDIDVDGKTVKISGQVDLYDTETKTLWDAKRTTSYKVTKGTHDEYEQQLNIGRWLMNNVPEKIAIGSFIKDFNFRESMYNKNYPKAMFHPIPLRVWETEEVEEFIRKKVREKLDPTLTPCTEEERWKRSDSFAVMKEGNKRAVRVFYSMSEAAEFAHGNEKMYIEQRDGENVRCLHYCKVKDHCPFFEEFNK